jgi:hypothetical protein
VLFAEEKNLDFFQKFTDGRTFEKFRRFVFPDTIIREDLDDVISQEQSLFPGTDVGQELPEIG